MAYSPTGSDDSVARSPYTSWADGPVRVVRRRGPGSGLTLRGLGAIASFADAYKIAPHGDWSDPRFVALVAEYKAKQNAIWNGALDGVRAMYEAQRQTAWDHNRQFTPGLPVTPPADFNPISALDPYDGWRDINQLTSSGIDDLSGLNAYLQSAGFTDFTSMGTRFIQRPGPNELAGDWVTLLFPYMTSEEQEAIRFLTGYTPPVPTTDFPNDPGRGGGETFNPYPQTVTLQTPDGHNVTVTIYAPIPHLPDGSIDWRALGITPSWENPTAPTAPGSEDDGGLTPLGDASPLIPTPVSDAPSTPSTPLFAGVSGGTLFAGGLALALAFAIPKHRR